MPAGHGHLRDEELRLEPVGTLEGIREDWQALADRGGNPFGTWEWAAAWWHEHGDGQELLLRRVRAADGRVVAVLPLYRGERGPLGLVRFLGHGPADELGPVCAPEDLPLAARALRETAAELPSRCLLLAERLPGERGLADLLGARRLRRESSPVLPIEGQSWEAWLRSRSANFREQVGRRERKLRREHGLRFRMTTDPARLDADLSTLVELHALRWQGGSGAFTAGRERLHRAFAHSALQRGWLRLCIAEADDQPIAAWYGLRFAGRDWYYQAGRDPRWDRYAAGFVLLVHTIRAAFEDGLREYRFGLGDEPYKARFATADHGLDTVVLGRAPVPQLAATAARGARHLPRRVRRVIARYAA